MRRLPGVEPEEAVVVGDSIYLADDEVVPEWMRAYLDPVTCSTNGPFTVTGQWTAVSTSTQPKRDGEIAPPYVITVRVVNGEHGGEEYRHASIHVRVTRATDPVPDRTDVQIALWAPGTVTARLHCEGRKFVAESVVASPARRSS